tara:strand:+ start:4701 stop:5798 length:1098 start_codon:yes stop_codon:yes gene_type:complete
MFRGPLRDAFNRDIFPNNKQPGAFGGGMNSGMDSGMNSGMNGGACAPFSSGPPAFQEDSPFGNIGSDSFGNVASYQMGGGGVGTEMGPNYAMHSGGGGYALPNGEQGYNASGGFVTQGGGYGSGANGYGGSNEYQTMQQSSPQANYESCGSCQGNSPNINYNVDPDYGMANDYNNVAYPPVENRDEHLSATHSSVDKMLIKQLKEGIIKISKQLKAKPDWVDLSPDGGASWKYSTMVEGNSIWCRVFTKIELHGERKGFKRPLPHICNVTTTTKIRLDSDLVSELLKEFPMMSYCPSTKNLQITMDSLEHNLAMLSLICSCQQDKISLDNIKYNNLPKKYMLLTTPGNKKYHPAAKYSLIRQIRS